LVVYDDGWVKLKDSPVVWDGVSFAGLMLMGRGRFQGRRQREQTRHEVLEATAPTVRAWQDAIAAEARGQEGYTAPVLAAEGFDLQDIAQGAAALATGTHPQDWAPEQRQILPGDLDQAQRAYVERTVERYASDPRVADALLNVPRMRFIDPEQATNIGTSMPFGAEQGSWSAQGPAQGRPMGALHGAWVATEADVAWACKAARINPGSRVLELSSEAGYRAAVLAKLGAEVHRVDGSEPRLGRLSHLLAGLGLTVATQLADPRQGWADAGPFDAILLDAGVEVAPTDLADQLGDRGILLLLDQGRSQRFMRRDGTLHQDQMLDMTAPDLSWGARRRDGRVETPAF
jgi:protein-L-isoaspartate(D-aspartate) O-methyltransferase